MRGLVGLILSCLVVSCGKQAEEPEIVQPPETGVAAPATIRANQQVAERLPLDDDSDFLDVDRGFIAAIEDEAILNADGEVVWSISQYDFIKGEAPETVNPSLWRQSKLAARHGLFKVTEGIYQVRGYDLSVMSVIEGRTGWIIIDPLTSTETAAASLKLVNESLGERPVSAVLYTHSHADHFGGVRGVISDDDVEAGVPVLAPIGFSENAVAENLLAGTHMSRRAALMFGNVLPRAPTAHIGSGLGPGLPNGTISLILPTEEIEGRGTQRIIDGVTFEFIDAAGTEAPAEFMFYLPELRALCTAEVATATFHNILTPRGAKVRDSLRWSEAIDYVLAEYGESADVVFASHHWPTWGKQNIIQFLSGQRDIYKYVHDQTLRRANRGQTMVEIAEEIDEPASQLDRFDTRGYYGTLNHNSKAVYQGYFGWWGGVMSEYFRLPHEQTANRYVEAMGGQQAVLAASQAAYEEGDYRWAAELLAHAVFADPSDQNARNWLASTYEQLGYQAESGTWRSYFLGAALELRKGAPNAGAPELGNLDFLKAVPSIDLFNAFATRFAPEKLTRDPFVLQFEFPDRQETVALHIGPSTVVPRPGAEPSAVAILTLDRTDLDKLALGSVSAQALIAEGDLQIEGDPLALVAFFAALESPDFWFNTQTP